MVRLASSEVDRAFAFLGRIDAAPSIGAFAEESARGLRELLGADIGSYNELAPSRHYAYFVVDPADSLFPGVMELVGRHIGDNPIALHYQRTGDRAALRLSDFTSKRAFRHTELYQNVYRPIGGEHLLVNHIGDQRSFVIGLAFFREQRDFTERERQLLDLLSPHLVHGYRTVQLRAVAGSLEAALDRDETGVLVVTRSGHVLHRTRPARDLLERYFGGNDTDALLPEPIAAWLRARDGQQLGGPVGPLHVARDGSRLIVEVVPDGDACALLLREKRLSSSPVALAALGLSRRQQEVLALVARGTTNKETARLLGVSERTVKKQLERIYEKLGVHTRTEAAARAREVTPAI